MPVSVLRITEAVALKPVYAYLVAQALRGNDGDLIADALVGLEVEGELGVVALDDDLGRLLDCLGANATHFCEEKGCLGELLRGFVADRRSVVVGGIAQIEVRPRQAH